MFLRVFERVEWRRPYFGGGGGGRSKTVINRGWVEPNQAVVFDDKDREPTFIFVSCLLADVGRRNTHAFARGRKVVLLLTTVTIPPAPLSPPRIYAVALLRAAQVQVLGPNTGGVLGLDFLNRYDMDLNFVTNEARLYVAGAVDQGLIDTSGLEGLSCGVLPGGKLGIKMELNG